jgi:hypothetical protein
VNNVVSKDMTLNNANTKLRGIAKIDNRINTNHMYKYIGLYILHTYTYSILCKFENLFEHINIYRFTYKLWMSFVRHTKYTTK